MDRKVYIEIKNEYERRQRNAVDKLASRQEQIYKEIPAIEEIDRRIKKAGLDYSKALLTGSIDKEKALSELNTEIERLRKEKSGLLLKSGYSADYLEPVYACSKCKDTGTAETADGKPEICQCQKQLIIDNIYSQSNLRLSGKDCFECFDLSLYSDKSDEARYEIKNSPRKQISGIREKCIDFIESFTSADTKNLLFCGPTGVGKTFMANCIAVELMNKGMTVLYQTAPGMFNSINEYRQRAFREDGYENEAYKRILDVDLLIIDDLGTESPSAARYADLLTIFDTRLSNDCRKPCKTIIISNIETKELFGYYDERIVSRIVGGYDIYRFAGDDIRKLKNIR